MSKRLINFCFHPNSGSNPVVIASPPDLAGMTLEERLLTYDWSTQFKTFQKVTQKGSFKVHCVGASENPIQVSEEFFLFFLTENLNC